MNQNIVIGIVAVLVVLGLGWYFLSGDTTSPSNYESTTPTTSGTDGTGSTEGTTAEPAATGSGSLQSLFSRSGNYTCSFTVMNPESEGNRFSGTFYGTSASQLRSDFKLDTSQGKVTESHMIQTGGYTYTWVDGSLQGTKIAAPARLQTTAVVSGGAIDNNGTASWECHPWVPEAVKFTLPQGISFVAK